MSQSSSLLVLHLIFDYLVKMIITENPYSGEKLGEYEEENQGSISSKVSRLRHSQLRWARDISTRLDALHEVKARFQARSSELARSITLEMGKPISQAEAEVKKSIWLIDYTIQTAQEMLNPENVKTEARRSYVRFDPLGVVLLIEPWNYPVWQVMRPAVPALAAGNAVVLNHASIVTGTSLLLEEIFGLDVFKSVVARGSAAENIIPMVDSVSFTGSGQTGARIASKAGSELKKCVLELGGSDPFIVLDNTNIESTVAAATDSRLQNAGQVCISAKRFIVHDGVSKEFGERLRDSFARVRIGNPMDPGVSLGPLSSAEQTKIVREQVSKLRALGEVEELAHGLNGNFIPPTIANPRSEFKEEVFGPVAIVTTFSSDEEALRLANDSPYGLGASLWGNSEHAERLVPYIEAGMVFVNKKVTSDPRLPFGGVKRSGFGRELSRYGILEFTNIKSVWVD